MRHTILYFTRLIMCFWKKYIFAIFLRHTRKSYLVIMFIYMCRVWFLVYQRRDPLLKIFKTGSLFNRYIIYLYLIYLLNIIYIMFSAELSVTRCSLRTHCTSYFLCNIISLEAHFRAASIIAICKSGKLKYYIDKHIM